MTGGGNAPFTVILTGGVASGKSVVSRLFAERGVPVVDTDVIASEIVQPGQPALAKIAERFGPEFLRPDGHLDRARMRRAIFSDPALKQQLEAILHPLIATESMRQISELDALYCILVVPLLAESPNFMPADRVLVVDASESLQLLRLMQRDSVDEQLARAMIGAQASRQQRLALADDVIENDGSLEQLEQRVQALHEKFLGLASRAKSQGKVC